MAMTRVREFVPPAMCDHEPVRLGDGSVRCIRCDLAFPAPKEPEWIRRMHAGELRTKDLTGLNGWSETELRAAWGDR